MQVIETDEGDCEPLVRRFKALQAKIGDTQTFLEIENVVFVVGKVPG